MKKYRILPIAFVALIGIFLMAFSSCEMETSKNGDLDGYRHLLAECGNLHPAFLCPLLVSILVLEDQGETILVVVAWNQFCIAELGVGDASYQLSVSSDFYRTDSFREGNVEEDGSVAGCYFDVLEWQPVYAHTVCMREVDALQIIHHGGKNGCEPLFVNILDV